MKLYVLCACAYVCLSAHACTIRCRFAPFLSLFELADVISGYSQFIITNKKRITLMTLDLVWSSKLIQRKKMKKKPSKKTKTNEQKNYLMFSEVTAFMVHVLHLCLVNKVNFSCMQDVQSQIKRTRISNASFF